MLDNKNVLSVIGGMGLLLTGRKIAALGLFSAGLRGLERRWREAHPEVDHGLSARWEAALDFYEATHRNKTNRWLHIVGIPMIGGGALGLLISGPPNPIWFGSAALFTTGWVLNIVGHAVFERNKPAFADDPLSFVAGPVWDLQQLVGRQMGKPPKLRVVDAAS